MSVAGRWRQEDSLAFESHLRALPEKGSRAVGLGANPRQSWMTPNTENKIIINERCLVPGHSWCMQLSLLILKLHFLLMYLFTCAILDINPELYTYKARALPPSSTCRLHYVWVLLSFCLLFYYTMSLMSREYDIEVPLGAEPSLISHSPYLGQLWVP